MRVPLEFGGERVELEIPDGRLVASWRGPDGVAPADLPRRIDDALESPADFPPLRRAVVPGDRVAVALGADVPEPGPVLEGILRVLGPAGVEPESVTVVVEPGEGGTADVEVPAGLTVVRHDPEDRSGIAYLASTSEGRRVYLSRRLTDADFVLPVGRLAYDPVLGYGGPWGAVFPGLSDAATRAAFRSAAPGRARRPPLLDESAEVSWLLGSQFQVGVVPGVKGVAGVVAGLGTAVLDRGAKAVDDAWGFRAESRAELVVVGVGLGRAGETPGFGELSRGLATAIRLVQRGGKIVVLSHVSGQVGNALQRFIDRGDPRVGPGALKGTEAEPDHADALRIAEALAWADVYLLSGLDRDLVDDLAMIPLDRPAEAGRLAALAGSSTIVSHADLVRATVEGE